MQLTAVSRTLEAPIGEVWAVTSSFGGIQAWMSGIKRVSIRGAGIGAVRTVATDVGVVDEELLVVDGNRYRVRYRVHSRAFEGIEGFVGGTDLGSVGANATRLTWVAEAESAPADIAPLKQVLDQFIEASIVGLGRLLNASVS